MEPYESKIAFICFHEFFGIGAFQWVTGRKNKKFRPFLNSRPGLYAKRLGAHFSSNSTVARPAGRSDSANEPV
jgi:hypothetical protein